MLSTHLRLLCSFAGQSLLVRPVSSTLATCSVNYVDHFTLANLLGKARFLETREQQAEGMEVTAQVSCATDTRHQLHQKKATEAKSAKRSRLYRYHRSSLKAYCLKHFDQQCKIMTDFISLSTCVNYN